VASLYTWTNRADLAPGTTYYYWLEDVDTSGATTLHGPVSATVQAPTAVTLASISASGLATAAAVFQDSPAVVQGTYQNLTSTLSLTVLNTLPDNFGAYAADGIDDDWQVLYFNLPPNPQAAPGADPDGDGQSNLFEFTAGLIPTSAASTFVIQALPVTGQPAQMRIVFSPRLAGRSYTVQTSTTLLAPSWLPLTTFTISDDGTIRTVTDTSTLGIRKFYRVQITRP
jgi:hypothetical protein